MKALAREDFTKLKAFADQSIGKDYYSLTELEEVFRKSQKNNVMCSFVLQDEKGDIKGLRLTYAPGLWSSGKGQGLRSDLWGFPAEHVGYFQSLFLSAEVQGQGWGPKLSAVSIEALKKAGARAIATHAWKESPNNSSLRYLQKLGFKAVIEHPDYWMNVDYVCTRDGKPCRCTAVEMILPL